MISQMGSHMKYIIVDGRIIPSTPESNRWLQRARKQVPQATPAEDKGKPELPKDTRTEFQILESLEETDGE